MKKIILVATALCMAFAGITAASAQEASDSFVVRDGITWGMSEAEVTALEGDGYQSEEQNGLTLVYYPAVRLGDYEAHLIYAFASDRLQKAFYGVEQPDQEMFDSLKQNCRDAYGEEKETAPEALLALMDGLQPGAVTMETVQGWEVCRWDAADGMEVGLIWEKHDDDFRIELACVSPEHTER